MILRAFNQKAVEYFGDKLIKGVEVGVHLGYNATEMLSCLNFEKLYLVDAWSKQTNDYWADAVEKEDGGWGTNALEDAFNIVTCNLGKYTNVEIIRLPSLEASEEFEDGSLDLIYIDAAHTYKALVVDLVSWYGKLKSGGLFGGHDYIPSVGVKQAVDEFAINRNRVVNTRQVLQEHAGSCWWLEPI